MNTLGDMDVQNAHIHAWDGDQNVHMGIENEKSGVP